MTTETATLAAPSARRTVALPPAVRGFVDAARAQFGDRLERIVLYGSRARGDARPDSDYDIAIFVRELENWYVEYKSLAGLAGQILADDDIEINADLHPVEDWDAGTSRLMRAIRNEGLVL